VPGRYKTRYDWLKHKGYCVCCGKEKALPGITLCLACRFDARERMAARRESEITRARDNAGTKERRARAKETGLCTRCCRRPARAGKSQCSVCAAKNAGYYKKRASGTLIADFGECRYCGKERVDGYSFCRDCLIKRQASMLYARSFFKNDNYFARTMNGLYTKKGGEP